MSGDERILQGLAPIAEQMGTTAADLLAGLRAESAEQMSETCDHEAVTNGVCMECGEQVGPITVTLTLAGLPANCPHCAAYPPDGQWALSPVGLVLSVVCPRCFTAVAPIRAIAEERQP